MPPALATSAASWGVLNPPAMGARTMGVLSFGKGKVDFHSTEEVTVLFDVSFSSQRYSTVIECFRLQNKFLVKHYIFFIHIENYTTINL